MDNVKGCIIKTILTYQEAGVYATTKDIQVAVRNQCIPSDDIAEIITKRYLNELFENYCLLTKMIKESEITIKKDGKKEPFCQWAIIIEENFKIKTSESQKIRKRL